MTYNPKKWTRLAPSLLLALSAGSTLAQSVPDIGDALRQAQPPAVPPVVEPVLPKVGGRPVEPPMAALLEGQAQIKVNEFVIVGNRVIDSESLLAQVRPEQGKHLSLAELEAIANRLTSYYRGKGYFVARAYVPAQDVTNGKVTLRIVEGNYGQLHLRNQSRVRDNIVQGMLDDIKGYDIVSLDTLERAILIINDTPGVQVVRADVMPGEKVGTSDFAVDTVATAPYAGFVMLDNFGSRYTGKNRLSFNADVNAPSGSGDRLSVSGLATDTSELLNGRIGYSTLLAPNGLRGEVALSQTQYQLGDTYSALDAQGTAKGFDATLTYPIRRIRAQTIETSLNLSYKDLFDEIRSTGTRTPKTLTSVTAGLNLRDESGLLGFSGLTQASLSVTAGNLDIREATAAVNDAAGAQTQGQFIKLNASLSRVNLLPMDFTLTASLKLQQSLNNKNLDGSERMAVGGPSAVMAYPSGELTGTNAALVRLELARPLPEWKGLRSNWLVFADWGQARQAKPLATDPRRDISDIGLGWNVTYGRALLKAYVAHRLDGTAAVSEPTPKTKFLAQAGWVF